MVLAFMNRWEEIPPLSVSVAMIATGLGAKFGKKTKIQKPRQGLPEAQGAPESIEMGEDALQGLLAAFGGSSEKPSWLTTKT